MYAATNSKRQNRTLQLAVLTAATLSAACVPLRTADLMPKLSVATGIGKSRMIYDWYSRDGLPRRNAGLFANGGFSVPVTPRLSVGAEAGYWSAIDFIDSPELKTAYVAPNVTLELPPILYLKVAAGPAQHWGDDGFLRAYSLLGSTEAGIDFGHVDDMHFEVFAGYQRFFFGRQPHPSSEGAPPDPRNPGMTLTPSKAFSGSLLQFGLRVRAK